MDFWGKWTNVVPPAGFRAGFDEQHVSPNGSTIQRMRRPTNRLSECTPKWLALLTQKRFVAPKPVDKAQPSMPSRRTAT